MKYIETEKHLWTDIEIQIISSEEGTQEVLKEVFLYCEAFENEFSRFQEESTLSRLNAHKSLEVSDRFIRLLRSALFYKAATNGYFSPFIDISTLWYSQSFDSGVFTPSKKRHVDEAVSIRWNIVTLGTQSTLDFWGIWKWFLVEEIKQLLFKKWYFDFCINAGWDISVSWQNSIWGLWNIAIENPFNGESLWVFACSGVSINTSGNYKRKWSIGDKKYHHIVDPYTWKNVNDFISVTIIAQDCTYGDAFTKWIWHLPFDTLARYFREHDLDGVVVTKTGKIFASPGMVEKYQFEMIS